MATLLMLSGGADSAVALIKLLTENDEPVFCHHIIMIDSESQTRHKPQEIACEKIVKYCRKHYRDFTYTKSSWNFPLSHFGWNLTLCAFVGARVLRSFRRARIDRYAVGVIDEPHTLGMWEERLQEIEMTFYGGLVSAKLPYKPEIIWPVADMTKTDILNSLPDELLEIVSFCRNPSDLGNNTFQPCGKCISCNTRKEVGRFESESLKANDNT
jgi:hypothetical protein